MECVIYRTSNKRMSKNGDSQNERNKERRKTGENVDY